MSRSEIVAKLQGIMRVVFDEEDLEITDETTADDVAEWDSANHVRFIMAVEEAFKVTFTSDEILSPENVGDLVTLIESKPNA